MRDQPDLTHCHSCATGVGGSRRLLVLPSEWRIVLLCSICLSALRSRLICSYCLRPISSTGDTIDCSRCSARIHIRCIPGEQRYLSLSDLSPPAGAATVFSCVDCCALPRSLSLFLKSSQNCSPEIIRESLNAPAMVKIGVGKRTDERKQSDEELAFRFHLAMNGSRRILRNRSPKINGDAKFRENNNNSSYNGLQLWSEAENSFFDDRGTSSSGRSSCEKLQSSSIPWQVEECRSRDDRYMIKYGRRKNRYLKKYGRRKNRYLKKYSRRKSRSGDTITEDVVF